MTVFLICLGVFIVLAGLFVAALGRASRQLQSSDRESSALAALAEIRSPTGQRFFATDQAAMELAEVLEGDPVDVQRPRSPTRRRRGLRRRH